MTLIAMKLHLLLPSHPLQHIYIGKGSGFASQNVGYESFLYLKGIVSFSVPTFWAQDSLMCAQGPHHTMSTCPPQARWGPTDCSAQVTSPSLKKSQLQHEPFLYLVPFQSTRLNQINYLLRGSWELLIDTSRPTSFNPSNIRLVSHQDNNPICKSATFIR